MLLPTAAKLDAESGGALTRAMAASRFKGKGEETLSVLAPAHLEVARVLLYGIGKPGASEPGAWQNRGGNLVAQLNAAGEKTAAIAVDHAGPEEAAIAADIAFGARLRSYRFDKYRTKEKPEQKAYARGAHHPGRGPGRGQARLPAARERIAEAVFFSRDLISEPANIIYPESLAEAARALEKLGVEVEVLDEKQMKKLGMNALLGVGQGSVRPPRLVVHAMEGQPQGQEPGARWPSSARA